MKYGQGTAHGQQDVYRAFPYTLQENADIVH